MRSAGISFSPPPCGEVGERSDPGGGPNSNTVPHPKNLRSAQICSTSPQGGGEFYGSGHSSQHVMIVSGSALPPDKTMAMDFPSIFPASSAASAPPPPGSTTSFNFRNA